MPEQKTICLIEDDTDVRDSLCVILQSCGYRVEAHGTADGFQRRTGAERIDCLLLDLNMPGMNGMELLELLRARGVATPAIILTASGERMNARMQRAGVIKLLHKPVSDEDLLQWIEKACASRDTYNS